MNTDLKYTPKDYKSDQYVRWCPGCGDHATLNCLHKAMAEVGIPPHQTAVISGIGCSSRLRWRQDVNLSDASSTDKKWRRDFAFDKRYDGIDWSQRSDLCVL